MPSALEYEQRILTYDWEQLLTLWEAVESRDTPDWDAGKAFEYLVLRALSDVENFLSSQDENVVTLEN